MRGLLAALALLAAAPADALEVEPLVSVRLLGGQYSFHGERASLGGNAAALFAPAVLMNGRWTLLPSLSSEYQGTKQAVDLVGAGALVQQRMEHRGALRAVYAPEGSRWLWKPSLAYGAEFLKETADERWGRGLFDSNRFTAGLEAEYVYREPYSFRAAVDYGFTHFPNYGSLESAAALDFQGQPLARELVGDRVLDGHTNMLTLGLSAPVGQRMSTDWTLVLRRRSFPNQRLVDASGGLKEDGREDLSTSLSASLRLPVELDPRTRLSASLSAGFAQTRSNQGSYDARNLRFIPGFYDFLEFSVGPGVALSLGDEREPVTVSLAGGWSLRRYPGRPAQDTLGTYGSEMLRQSQWTWSLAASYPMAPRLRMVFSLRAARASSNQGFERFYSYDYGTTDCLMGFSYDY
jgi:hypothetical protein